MPDDTDPHADAYLADLETATLAAALADTSDIPPSVRKRLRRVWMIGIYNAAAAGLEKITGQGLLEWIEHEGKMQLLYRSPIGPGCSLGQVYEQPNGTWAALVIAGVRDNPFSAMAAAEWAVSRLTGGAA